MRLLAFIFLLTSSNLISQEIKRADSERSSISYTGKHFLHKWSAENKNISGLIQIEDESISNIGIVLKVSDFKSGNSSLDSNSLRVLDALQFPNVIFKSADVKQENGEIIFEGKNFVLMGSFDVPKRVFATEIQKLGSSIQKTVISSTDYLI